MKKLILGAILATLFASAVVFSNPAMNKAHKGTKAGAKGDAKVNCVYCHKTAGLIKKRKAHVEDKKARPVVFKFKQVEFCKMSGCHPLPSKK
ncbi:MAG: hypothetical protein GY854_11240 [Deltaproteobacteria bacterium]|nr:hypothetical protein [Deltaproteobacteria bacterium]